MAHTDNVAGFWDLASNSTDQSGHGKSGTDTSMSYDGTYGIFSGSGFITLPSLGTGNLGTWAGWFRDSGTGYAAQCSGGSTTNDLGTSITIMTAEGRAAAGYSGATKTATLTNTLVHIVVTNDGTHTNIWVNGVSGTQGNSGAAGNTNFYIGKAFDGFSNANGKMRCVAFYSDVKDSTWVTADYNSGTPKKWADWNPANSRRRRLMTGAM